MIILYLLLLVYVSNYAQDSLSVFVGVEILNEKESKEAKAFNKIRSSDGIKIYIKHDEKDIYFYLLNQYDDIIQLSLKEKIQSDTLHEIPNNAEFIFDGKYSEEKIFIIIASKKLDYLEDFFLQSKRKIEDWFLIEEGLSISPTYEIVTKEEFIKIAGSVRASEKIQGKYIGGYSPLLIKYSFYIKK